MLTYGRTDLLGFRPNAPPTLGMDVCDRVQQLGLRRHRGRRAGRAVLDRASRPLAVLRPAGNGAYTISSRRPSARSRVYGSNRRNVVPVPVIAQRHTQTDQSQSRLRQHERSVAVED